VPEMRTLIHVAALLALVAAATLAQAAALL
jgi:hypothetical protein